MSGFRCRDSAGTFGDVSDALKDRVGLLLEIVEPKAREMKIVTLSASEINSEITSTGRVVLYGIFFDFDKSVIKLSPGAAGPDGCLPQRKP